MSLLRHFTEIMGIGLNGKVRHVLNAIPIDFGGGCSRKKALLFAGIIHELQFKVTVDIGVYRGRSFFPQALAHRYSSDGIVYGVDPYDPTAAQQNDTPELANAMQVFVAETNFDSLFESVQQRIHQMGLEKHATLLRMTSSEAAKHFRDRNIECDLVHIDGNHDTEAVLSDVSSYIPLLSASGILVLDDVSWKSVRPALELAQRDMKLLVETHDDWNDFAVLCHKGPTQRPAVAKLIRRWCT